MILISSSPTIPNRTVLSQRQLYSFYSRISIHQPGCSFTFSRVLSVARGMMRMGMWLYDQSNSYIPKKGHNYAAFWVDGNGDYTSFFHIEYRCVHSRMQVVRYRESIWRWYWINSLLYSPSKRWLRRRISTWAKWIATRWPHFKGEGALISYFLSQILAHPNIIVKSASSFFKEQK